MKKTPRADIGNAYHGERLQIFLVPTIELEVAFVTLEVGIEVGFPGLAIAVLGYMV